MLTHMRVSNVIDPHSDDGSQHERELFWARPDCQIVLPVKPEGASANVNVNHGRQHLALRSSSAPRQSTWVPPILDLAFAGQGAFFCTSGQQS